MSAGKGGNHGTDEQLFVSCDELGAATPTEAAVESQNPSG
jgi:hypothetical protein